MRSHQIPLNGFFISLENPTETMMLLTETMVDVGDESTYDWDRMGVLKNMNGGEPESSLSSGVQELAPD